MREGVSQTDDLPVGDSALEWHSFVVFLKGPGQVIRVRDRAFRDAITLPNPWKFSLGLRQSCWRLELRQGKPGRQFD